MLQALESLDIGDARLGPHLGEHEINPRDARSELGQLRPRQAANRAKIADLHGVDPLAVLDHLEMQMRAGRAPGAADIADDIALLHPPRYKFASGMHLITETKANAYCISKYWQ